MSFIKQYRNTSQSLLFCVLAVAWYFGLYFLLIYLEQISIFAFNLLNNDFVFKYVILFGPSAIFSITGVFFAFKSNKLKESSWAGNLLMLIGIIFSIISLWPFFLMFYLGFFYGR